MKDFPTPPSVAWSAFNAFDKKPHDVWEAILYLRVSSKAQIKRGHGLESQETRLREYAKFKQYSVFDVFADDLTGKVSGRPGIQDLLAFLKTQKGKRRFVILIDDITRFARSVRTHEDLRDAILEAGGILESPSVEFGHNADSRMIEYVLATMSQHQREKNAEQTVSRMRARLQNGYWCYQPPIGYVHKEVTGHGKLIVRNEPIASIIQEALEGFASGRFDTQVEVKRFFESQPEFPKDLPGGQVRNHKVTKILKRSVYAGMVEAPVWGVTLREGKHQGLISFATYEKIQQRLRDGARAPSRKDVSADFPLRGSVVCGDCGKPLTACWSTSETGQKHPYYQCFTKGCVSYRKSIRRDKIEGEFEALLQGLQPTEGLFNIAKAMFRDAWDQQLTQAKSIAAAAKSEIGQIDKQIEQLLDRVVEASRPSVIAAFEKRIDKLEREKLVMAEKTVARDKPLRPFNELFELAISFLSSPYKIWTSGTLEHKKTVLKLAFSERLAYCRNKGFRTPKTTLPFKALGAICADECVMARPGRFELPTS